MCDETLEAGEKLMLINFLQNVAAKITADLATAAIITAIKHVLNSRKGKDK